MTNFEKIKNINNIVDMAIFLTQSVPEWKWEDKCVVDCTYNGDCSNTCAIHFLNEKFKTETKVEENELEKIDHCANENDPVVFSTRDLPIGFEGDYLLEKGNGREAWFRCDGVDYKERG